MGCDACLIEYDLVDVALGNWGVRGTEYSDANTCILIRLSGEQTWHLS